MNISVEPQDVAIETADHAKIAGVYYPCTNCSAAVLVCAAMGVGQKAYANFARWLNKEGFAVLTFDYRGVADSLFGMRVKNSLAKQHEWGQFDMTAALAYLSKRHPSIPLQIVGDDIAGILMGLMPNYAQISGAVALGGSTFYVSRLVGISRIIANLFFRLYIPLCLSIFRYVPLKIFGWGEDIPAGVARQWACWRLRAGHIRNSFGGDIKRHFYRDFRAPILVLHTGSGTDKASNGANKASKGANKASKGADKASKGADKASIDDMSDLYRSAVVEYKQIDHFNLFQSRYAKLWTVISDWLKAPERQTIRTYILQPQMQAVIEALPAPHPTGPIIYPSFTHQTKFIGKDCKKIRVSSRA